MSYAQKSAGMVAGLVSEVVGWGAGGFRISSPELVKKRLAECASCEHFKMKRCSKCGCYMGIKASMETSKCPIGRW